MPSREPPTDPPPAPAEIPARRRDAMVWLLRLAAVYLLVSSLTFPIIDWWWIGEFPPLAVLQFPKLEFAGWLRQRVVMPVIGWLGLSQGSFSPDYILASPYALALAYVIPAILIVVVLLSSRTLKKMHLVWLTIAAVTAVIDFIVLQCLGSNSLTLY